MLLGLGLGVLAKLLWDAINRRPGTTTSPPQDGQQFLTGSAVNAGFTLLYDDVESYSGAIFCPNGLPVPGTFPPSTTGRALNLFGIGVEIGATAGGSTAVCGPGDNIPAVTATSVSVVQSNGSVIPQATIQVSRTTFAGLYGFTRNNTNANFRLVFGGVTTPLENQTPQEVPEVVRPAVPFPLPSTAPEPFRLPAPDPVPTILPATVPDTTPVPAPATAPSGLPAAEPATAPAPATVPTLVRTVTTSTPGSQPQTLTATEVTTAPAPAPIRQTPAEAVMIGGQLVGGPGTTPPASPAGTAAELGRIEKKMELALDKISPLGELVDALGLLGELLSLLEEEHGGGSYSIRPACGTDAQGNPLPVIDVPIAGGLGVVGAIVPRLDAIAELLDLHKQLRQPVCKGKPTGDPVTVTGVEVD